MFKLPHFLRFLTGSLPLNMDIILWWCSGLQVKQFIAVLVHAWNYAGSYNGVSIDSRRCSSKILQSQTVVVRSGMQVVTTVCVLQGSACVALQLVHAGVACFKIYYPFYPIYSSFFHVLSIPCGVLSPSGNLFSVSVVHCATTPSPAKICFPTSK